LRGPGVTSPGSGKAPRLRETGWKSVMKGEKRTRTDAK